MTTRTATLQIVMERDFETFDQEQRDAFLSDLSEMTGCTLEQMGEVRFRPGCVVASVKLPEEAVRGFLALWTRVQNDEDEALSEFADFLHRHNVESTNGKFQVEMQIIAPKPESRPQVVFVHGWSGDDATFGELPEIVQEDLGCEKFVYQYPTGVLQHSPSIFFLARNLDNWCRNHLRSDKIGFVMHSMGGLVVRKFITLQHLYDQPLDDRIRQLTFIASPHDGADLATIGSKVWGVKSEQLKDLASGSSFVAELKTGWLKWSHDNVPNQCTVRSILGTKDSVVSPTNAIGGDIEAVPILGATHKDIVKPTSRDSEVVLTVERFLEEAGLAVG